MLCVLDVAVPQTGSARALSLVGSTLASELEATGSLPCSSLKATEPTGVQRPSLLFPECLNPLVRHSRSSSVAARSSSAPRSSGAKRSPSLKIFRRCCYATFQFYYIHRTLSRSRSVAGFHLFPIPIPIAPHLGSLSRFASFPSKFPLFLTNPESGIISHAAVLTADDGEIFM